MLLALEKEKKQIYKSGHSSLFYNIFLPDDVFFASYTIVTIRECTRS